MKSPLIDLLDFELAWKRVKLDILQNNFFVEFPNEFKLIESNLEKWIEQVKLSIEKETYKPQQVIICEVPKKGGSTRPAAYLEYEDRLIYAACVGACYKEIYEFIFKEVGQIDISNTLSSNSLSVEWVSSGFGAWKRFNEKSLEMVNSFANYVVITDVSACFENIDIKRLLDDLRDIGCNSQVLNLLSNCLNTWSKLVGRGIPQGYNASQILGKFYLSQVDNFLKDDFQHLRYVDDIRIFCISKIEAKKSLMELVKHLRARGLNIQTSKTGIYKDDLAKEKIKGIQPIINQIKDQYLDDFISDFDNEYLNFIEIEKIITDKPEDTPIEIIEIAFDKHMSNESEENFNKSLFRFLLKRFAKVKNTYGVKFCLSAIENHPEETDTILTYIKNLNLNLSGELFKRIEHFLASFLSSERSIYQYQNYLIIKFFSEINFEPSTNLMRTIRKIVFEQKSELFLVCIGLHFLSRYGNNKDFEIIEYEFQTYHQKVQIESIFTLKNMEKAKRNHFYSRINLDGSWHEKAIDLVKVSS